MYSLKKEYPVVTADLGKLRHNIDQVTKMCTDHGISVAGVVKGFNGIPEALKLYDESALCIYCEFTFGTYRRRQKGRL